MKGLWLMRKGFGGKSAAVGVVTLLAAVVLVAAVFTGAVFAAEKKVLKVGSDCTYAPFEMINEKGEPDGFDIDIINAVAAKMGYEVQIINTAWDGIFPGLINGNYDVIISAVTITKERAKSMAFSTPYYTAETGQVIVVKKTNNEIKTPADLKGKVVAVQINTTGQYAAEEIKGVKKIKAFNTTPEALQDVINGASDAAVIDSPVAEEFLKEHPTAALKVTGPPFTKEQYGIVVRKDNTKLLAEVNKALEAIKADGTYDKIYNKWFGTKK